MKILITGIAGFIGHHLAEHILKNTDWDIIGLDRIDHAGSCHRLHEIFNLNMEEYFDRVKFVWHDLKAPINESVYERLCGAELDHIIHLAASTHVDRSIRNPIECIQDNVIGTAHILEFLKDTNVQRFIYFSTDEVFGPAPKTIDFDEWDRYRSQNPYAASKAGAEELCLAYANTYSLPIIITHCMNAFGERQNSEKYIPSTIRKILYGASVTVHSDETLKNPGSRHWLYVQNISHAIMFLLQDRKVLLDKYNIVGTKEVDNLEVAQTIAKILNEELKYEMVDFHSSRPGHDLRYALQRGKLEKMGFKYPFDFETSLTNTVKWYMENQSWLV
jgi:dTDP-glucose 4,6-dehydratase